MIGYQGSPFLGIKIASSQLVKKRWKGIQIGDMYYIHPKTYKKLCRAKGERLEGICNKIVIKHRVPKQLLDLGPFPVRAVRFDGDLKSRMWLESLTFYTPPPKTLVFAG